MKKTIVTVVIEFDGELEQDMAYMAVDQMIEPGLNSQEKYSVVDFNVIEE